MMRRAHAKLASERVNDVIAGFCLDVPKKEQRRFISDSLNLSCDKSAQTEEKRLWLCVICILKAEYL